MLSSPRCSMAREHDKWSKLGEDNLGELNIRFGEKAGFDILMKAIINDHWADASKEDWPREHVDYVMSKIYYCWVRQLWEKFPEEEEGVSFEELEDGSILTQTHIRVE